MRPFCRSKRNVLAPDSEFMPRYLVRNTNDDNDDDGATIMTYSTMATTDSNRGAGWTVDRYILQPAGRWIESWASRIGLQFGVIPPSLIARRLHELLHPTYKISARSRFSPRLEFLETNRVTIDNGIDCLLKQLQSPSQSRRAVACAVLIWFQWYRHDMLKRTYEALAKRCACDCKSNRARTEIFSNNSSTSSRHRVYHHLLLSFLNQCVKDDYPSDRGVFINPKRRIVLQGLQCALKDKLSLDNSLFIKSAKTELLQMVENIHYDPVLIIHKACLTLHKCLLEWHDIRFVEIFYFYMCFLLNILQHVQPLHASLKEHHISLIPYINWIDSILSLAFICISGDSIVCDDISIVLRLYSLFALPQVRNLFPRYYVKTNFNSGPYGAAKRRAAKDASSYEALTSHIRGDVGISEQFDFKRVKRQDTMHWVDEKYFFRKPIRHDPMKRMAETDWARLIPRFLDQRVWEYTIANREYDFCVDLWDTLFDNRFDSMPRSSTPRAFSQTGAVLFGGDSVPIIEYSRHSQTPMTIAFFCKETGRTIYRTVELPSEEAAALEEAEDEA